MRICLLASVQQSVKVAAENVLRPSSGSTAERPKATRLAVFRPLVLPTTQLVRGSTHYTKCTVTQTQTRKVEFRKPKHSLAQSCAYFSCFLLVRLSLILSLSLISASFPLPFFLSHFDWCCVFVRGSLCIDDPVHVHVYNFLLALVLRSFHANNRLLLAVLSSRLVKAFPVAFLVLIIIRWEEEKRIRRAVPSLAGALSAARSSFKMSFISFLFAR